MYGQATLPSRNPKPQATACRPCAKAKVKCVYSIPGTPCERCARLNKDCFSQQISERRAPLPRSRFAQLEHKVETLMKELERKDQPHLSDSYSAGPSASQDPSPGSSIEHSVEFPQNGAALLSDGPARFNPQPMDISSDDLAQCFYRYREEMAPYFPFVFIPDVSPAKFYAEKPFLFKAMVMVSSYRNRPFQNQLGSQITEEAGKRLLVDGERSLDLLQGLLIHIAWYQLHLGQVSQMTTLLSLAISLLADLGLNKPTHGSDRRKLMFDSSRISQGALAESRPLTNDETRALLGCFYVSSIVCAIFRRIPALEYTNYMEKHLQALLASGECDEDFLLARMIHIQQFAERVVEAVRTDEPEDPAIQHAPVALHLKTLRKEFRSQPASSHVGVEDNQLILLQKYAVEVLIHENGINNSFWNLTSTSNDRIDVLWNLLQSIKAYFETFLSLPPLKIHRIPYSGWGQSTYVILLFSRLSNLNCPGWDPQVARDTYDFPVLVERLLNFLEEANYYAGVNWLAGEPDPIIMRAIGKVKFIQKWWHNTQPGLSPSQLQPFSPKFDFPNGSVLGDDFWDELMRDCEPLQF